MPNDDNLNGEALRKILWSATQQVRSGELPPANLAAMASAAREILRSVKINMALSAQQGKSLTLDF